MRTIVFPLLLALSCGEGDLEVDDHDENYDDEASVIDAVTAAQCAHRWSIPAATRAAGDAQYVAYEAAEACSGGATSGALVLADFVRQQFRPQINFGAGSRGVGIYNCRSVVGGSSLSLHGEGRALDIFIPTDGNQPGAANNALGDVVANWMIEHAEWIGVQYIVWDRGSWNASRNPPKDRCYGGSHPHNDHVHVELTRAAASMQTDFFRGVPDPEPTVDPKRRVSIVPSAGGGGYWVAAADGGVFSFGDAGFFGSMGGAALAAPVVGMAATPGGAGYWLVAADGGIFAFGDARFFGSTGGLALAAPVVGMAATPSGAGYWLVAADGGIFAFGDARFFGSTGGLALAAPVVGMAATPSGAGYWLVASDGGIFSFGDARFFGSTGGTALNAPVVEMAATPSGAGYWLVASDGGIFSFGDARFFGSMGGKTLNAPMSAIARTPSGGGYWTIGSDGGVFSFGNAGFFGAALEP